MANFSYIINSIVIVYMFSNQLKSSFGINNANHTYSKYSLKITIIIHFYISNVRSSVVTTQQFLQLALSSCDCELTCVVYEMTIHLSSGSPRQTELCLTVTPLIHLFMNINSNCLILVKDVVNPKPIPAICHISSNCLCRKSALRTSASSDHAHFTCPTTVSELL